MCIVVLLYRLHVKLILLEENLWKMLLFHIEMISAFLVGNVLGGKPQKRCKKFKFLHFWELPLYEIWEYTGVLNLILVLVCGPKGHKWGLKERIGTKNRGLKNLFFFFFEKIGLKEMNFG